MHVQPYLSFDGKCEEAIEFYKKSLGAEVQMLLRFKDSPEQGPPGSMPPGTENKVMHSTLKIGDSIVMASDCRCQGAPSFGGFSLALETKSDADAERFFGNLANGGQVQMPLTKTFFSSKFGVVADRFGVSWMITVAQNPRA
jgi:PhnB protein